MPASRSSMRARTRFLRQHVVHGEMLSDVAHEIHGADRQQPVGVVRAASRRSFRRNRRKRASCAWIRATFAVDCPACRSGRSSDLPRIADHRGAAADERDRPCPARAECASSIIGTRLPMCRLGAVGSKPQYAGDGCPSRSARRVLRSAGRAARARSVPPATFLFWHRPNLEHTRCPRLALRRSCRPELVQLPVSPLTDSPFASVRFCARDPDSPSRRSLIGCSLRSAFAPAPPRRVDVRLPRRLLPVDRGPREVSSPARPRASTPPTAASSPRSDRAPHAREARPDPQAGAGRVRHHRGQALLLARRHRLHAHLRRRRSPTSRRRHRAGLLDDHHAARAKPLSRAPQRREKTLGRKLREAKVARAIEAKYSKDRSSSST